MSAVRLARAATRRDRLIKFAGNYHGHVDALLASAGSGLMTLGIPSTPGVPSGVAGDTIVLPYNDIDAVAAAVARVRRGARGDPRRAGRRQHGRRPSCARLPRGAADAVRRERRAARLRRGDHRLPRRARRGAGALRRHARPDDPRQDRRRRPAGGGVRRPGRADGAPRAGRRRLPGGHAVREPACDGRRHVGAAPAPRPGRVRRARAPRRPARGGPRAVRHRPAGRGDADALLPGRRRAQTTTTRSAPTPSATGRSSGTCSTAASTWRRRSSSACSSRSPTATRRSTGRSRPLATSSTTEVDVWETLAAEAAAESPLWGDSLRPS